MKRKALLLRVGDIIIDDDRELLVRSVTNGFSRNHMLVHYKDLSTSKLDWTSLDKNVELKMKERR
jgi:hypothetical protein